MTSVVLFKQDNTFKPKTWKIFLYRGGKTAYVTCPSCKRTSVLYDFHIDDKGKVKEKFECPVEGCEYSSFIRLGKWKDWL